MILTLLFASTTVFPGGSANDFSLQLAEATKQNVVVCQSWAADFPKIEYDPADLTGMARAFNSKLGLRMAPGVELILTDGLVPPTRVGNVEPPKEPPKWIDPKTIEFSDGRVTLSTKDEERLNPALLDQAAFSKPLKVHWFFGELPVSVQAKAMPEADFLKYVSKAVGGKLTILPKEYRIDFDPDEIRGRVLKRLSTWPKEWMSNETAEQFNPQRHLAMLKALVGEMPRESFKQAFETEEGKGSFDIRPNGELAKLVKENMVLNMSGKDEDGGPAFQTPVGPLSLSTLLGGDFRIEASLSSVFTFYVGFMKKEEPNKMNINFAYHRLGRY